MLASDLALALDPVAPVRRVEYGLPEARFLFFFAFDALSYPERKNPRGVLEAFRRVRRGLPGRVGLVAGLFFGFSFGLGGLGAAALGQLADWTGIRTVYNICAFLPLLGLATAFLPRLDESMQNRGGGYAAAGSAAPPLATRKPG